jgi:hypothetical protein
MSILIKIDEHVYWLPPAHRTARRYARSSAIGAR